MATVAGVFGLALIIFAVVIRSMAAMLFVLAAALFVVALVFTVMSHRRSRVKEHDATNYDDRGRARHIRT